MIIAGREQIQGWKEIAAYLGRDERTVKRWEKQRGLPVRRIPGTGRANVYVVVSELELWLAQPGSTSPADPNAPSPSPSPSPERDAILRADPSPAPHPQLSPDVGSVPAIPEPAPPIPDAAASDPEPPLDPAAASLGLSPKPPERAELTHAAFRRSSRLPRPPRRLPIHFSFLLGLLSLALILVAFAVRTFFLVRDAQPQRAAGLPTRPAYISPSPGADELYLQGLYLYEQRTPASLENARRSFESAIARDANDALAFAGLANSFLLLREYSTMPADEAYTRAQVAAQRALALDPNLPEAHASLGFIDFFFLWDAPAATREFNQAFRLDPSCALAHHWYGSMLTHQGHYPEALDQLNLAQRLQPSSPAIVASKALALGLGGHRADAVEMLNTLGKTDLDTAAPHRILASLSLVQPRDIRTYVEETQRFAQIRNDRETLDLFNLASAAYHRGGERAMWSEILSAEPRLHPSADHPTFRKAEAEAALGLDSQALHDLELLAGQRNSLMVGLAIDPLLIPLHHDPRFGHLLAKVGLPHTPADLPGQNSPRVPPSRNASDPEQQTPPSKALAVSTASPDR